MIPIRRNIFWFVLIISIAKFFALESCNLFDSVQNKVIDTTETREWRAFLKDLQHKISLYIVQEDVNKFIQTTITRIDSNTEWEITQNNFANFVNMMKAQYAFEPETDFTKQILTDTQLQKLNYVLKIMLRDVSIKSCSEQDLIAYGNVVSLKKVLKLFRTQCKGKSLNDLRSLQLFAFHTVYFDHDIENNISLMVISPRWRVINKKKGKRTLELYGRDGNEYKKVPKIAERLMELEKIKKKKDGLPGVTGEPGGLFFGIGLHFNNGRHLKISTIGGDGGDGDGDNFWDWCVNEMKITYLGPRNDTVYWYLAAKSISTLNDSTIIKLGGHGGDKGLGGPPGDANLIQLQQESETGSEIKVLQIRGNNGKPGNGLIEGPGETLPWDVLECAKYVNGTITIKRDESDPLYHSLYDGRPDKVKLLFTQNETTGIDHVEYNYEDIVSDISKLKVLNDYQHYFRENFKISMKEFHHIDFIEKLNNDPKIYNFTSVYYENFTSYLIEELRQLENESYVPGRDVDLFIFYEFLLNKIEMYVTVMESSKNPSFDISEKRLLEYIYSTILSRRSAMNANFDSYLITNVPKFLIDLEKEFNELKVLSNTIDDNDFKGAVRNKMNELVTKFEDDIIAKTDAAKRVMDNGVQEEINVIKLEFKKEMDYLLKQINEKKEETKKTEKELQDTRHILEKHLYAEIINNIADAMCSALVLAGPEGAVAGALINVPVKISTNIYDSEYNARLNRVSAVKNSTQASLTSLNEKLTTMKETKCKRLKANFEEVIKVHKLDTISTYNSNLAKFIERTNKDTGDLDVDKITYEKLNQIEKDFNEKVKDEHINLKKSKQRFQKTVEILGKIEKVSFVPDLGVGLYTAFTNYSRETSALDITIQKNKELFESLKLFEQTEYPKLVEKLEKLILLMNGITNKIGTGSKVDLNLVKLRAEDVFYETRELMEKKLSDFKLKDTLFVIINKLERVLPFLISTNDVIQDIQEQKNLVQIFTDISRASVQDYNEKKTIIQSLEKEVLSNILLKKYNQAFKAWEQYVFPLAEKFLDASYPPEKLKVRENITDLVKEVEMQLKNINDKIQNYQHTILDTKVIKEIIKFSNNHGNTDPFFVWRNSEYKSEIKELLSGKEILLNADIRKELPPLINAIKFKEVRLFFRVNNTQRQKELKKLLNEFKITFKHFGNNYYTFNNRIYQTNTKPVEFSVYLDSNGASDGYSKVKENEGMLSPYALWGLKLEPEPKQVKKVEFSQLEAFADEVDLELEGTGSSIVLGYTPKKDYSYKSLQICQLPRDMPELARSKRMAQSSRGHLTITNFVL